MCGIAGFISKKFSESDLKNMTDCLRYRGPDAEGFYFDAENAVGLGHRRLSIIDLSEAANQPIYSRDGRYAIIFNGEIYNYKDVAAKYNIQQRTTSDTEVIIETFAKAGVECVNDFNGMFVIVIWDLEKKKLYIIRDRFGVKPLVYYWNGSDFAFASQLKALMKLPIERKININALQDYLFLEYIPAPDTILDNCFKLPKGNYIVACNGKIEIKEYYRFKDKIGGSGYAPDQKDNTVIESFSSLLSSAVKYRQVSDVPVGAFLSGGTDSSLICALFQEQNQNPVKTFTIGFDVKGFDESKYANEVAAILKTDHSLFHLNDKDSLSIVESLVDYYDEPFAAPSAIPSYLVCKEARHVVTVAMSGDGGDELFMGYGYYDLYKKIKKIHRFDPGIGRKLLSALFSQLSLKHQRASRLMQLPSADLFMHLWAEEQYMFSEKEISKLLNTTYSNHSIRDEWRQIDKMPIHDFEKISLLDIEKYLADNLLFKMDSASMANSLEVRNPFLDYRLMEYSFNLPLELKIKNGTQKFLMKELLRQYLPDHLVFRRKWGFPAPIGEWMYSELNYLLEKWLNPALLNKQGLFNSGEVMKIKKAFINGKKFHYKRLWSIIVFQMWYQKYIEQHAG
jgi:asparagine synthase (glutamine-hydrolysing)